MNLNEDGTITLSQRETQKFMTKVINPEYKQLERMRKFYKTATTQDISNVMYRLTFVEKKCADILDKMKLDGVPPSKYKSLEKELSYLNWCLQGSTDTFEKEEETEIEKAYNLYKMLLKHRRLSDE